MLGPLSDGGGGHVNTSPISRNWMRRLMFWHDVGTNNFTRMEKFTAQSMQRITSLAVDLGPDFLDGIAKRIDILAGMCRCQADAQPCFAPCHRWEENRRRVETTSKQFPRGRNCDHLITVSAMNSPLLSALTGSQ